MSEGPLSRRRAAFARLGAAVAEMVVALQPDTPAEPESAWMRLNRSPLPEKTRRALVADGTLTARSAGKFTYVRRDEHDAWIASQAPRVVAANDDDVDDEDADEGDDVLARLGLEAVPARRGGR